MLPPRHRRNWRQYRSIVPLTAGALTVGPRIVEQIPPPPSVLEGSVHRATVPKSEPVPLPRGKAHSPPPAMYVLLGGVMRAPVPPSRLEPANPLRNVVARLTEPPYPLLKGHAKRATLTVDPVQPLMPSRRAFGYCPPPATGSSKRSIVPPPIEALRTQERRDVRPLWHPTNGRVTRSHVPLSGIEAEAGIRNRFVRPRNLPPEVGHVIRSAPKWGEAPVLRFAGHRFIRRLEPPMYPGRASKRRPMRRRRHARCRFIYQDRSYKRLRFRDR
jgi:hypothetical protein